MSLDLLDTAAQPPANINAPMPLVGLGQQVGQTITAGLQGYDQGMLARQRAAELAGTLRKQQQDQLGLIGNEASGLISRGQTEEAAKLMQPAVALRNQLIPGANFTVPVLKGGTKQVPDGTGTFTPSGPETSGTDGFGGQAGEYTPPAMKSVPDWNNPQTISAVKGALGMPKPAPVKLTQGETLATPDDAGNIVSSFTAPTPGADIGMQAKAEKLQFLREKLASDTATAQEKIAASQEIARLKSDLAASTWQVKEYTDADGKVKLAWVNPHTKEITTTDTLGKQPVPHAQHTTNIGGRRMGWNQATGKYDQDLGPAVAPKPFNLNEAETIAAKQVPYNLLPGMTLPPNIKAQRDKIVADLKAQHSRDTSDFKRNSLLDWAQKNGAKVRTKAGGGGGGVEASPSSYMPDAHPWNTLDPSGPASKWSDAVYSAAQETGVPVAILDGVMRQESGGRHTTRRGKVLTSPAGALGLMQLMPDTARGLGVDPADPEQNILGGAKYLKSMYDRFGDWESALAAYNAGPGALRPSRQNSAYQVWQAPYNTGYQETRDYVKNIKADIQRRYGNRRMVNT